jgi:hypothetical protein
VLGGAAVLVSAGYLTGTALTITEACIAVATSLGVYVVPNAPPAPPKP